MNEYSPELDLTIDQLWPMFKRQHKITDEQEIVIKPLLKHWLDTTDHHGELLPPELLPYPTYDDTRDS